MSGRKPDSEEEPFKDPFDALYHLGLAIFCDDAPDFPQVVSTWGKEPGKHGVLKGQTMPDLPPHPHHWLIGALIMAGSAAAKVYVALEGGAPLLETSLDT
jgi:hypothetical protein